MAIGMSEARRLSLLDKAKKHTPPSRHGKDYTQEEEELCAAWMKDEVNLTQVAHALGLKSVNGAYSFLALCAKQLFRGQK